MSIMAIREQDAPKRRTRRFGWRLAIMVVWLACMAWLIRHEAFPHVFTHTIEGYKGIFSRDVVIEDSWMKILFHGSPIGYSHTNVDMDESGPVPQYKVFNQIRLKLKLLGEEQSLQVNTTVDLDMLYQLQTFTFNLTSRGYALRLMGVRKGDTIFDVVLRTAGGVQRLSLDIPKDVVLYSPMAEVAIRDLSPGKTMTLQTLDPATLQSAPVTLRALRREPLVRDGQTVQTTVVASEYRGVEVLSWLDHDGVLRQETPFGWTLERCSMEEAFAAFDAAEATGDLLDGMAVAAIGHLPSPRTTRHLRLQLKGLAPNVRLPTSPRQTMGEATSNGVEVITRQLEYPPAPLDPPPTPETLAPYLASTLAVQADHPDIRACAERITAGSTSPQESAARILDWVYRHVEKKITVSLPSALDVLRTMEGDCNEHTYLFTALARAAGLPTRIQVGLVYQNAAFYYHAWPSVFLGDWADMDPTFGQPSVDATHLVLVEGELAQQVELVGTMGRLTIEILDSE